VEDVLEPLTPDEGEDSGEVLARSGSPTKRFN